MLSGLDTLKWHLNRLLDQSDASSDARAEVADAIDDIQAKFDAIDQQLASMSRAINDLASYHN